MSENLKDTVKFISSLVLLIAGIVLVFISLYLPPEGVIDNSVLIIIGETFTFIGATWGIQNVAQVQVKKIEHSTQQELERIKALKNDDSKSKTKENI